MKSTYKNYLPYILYYYHKQFFPVNKAFNYIFVDSNNILTYNKKDNNSLNANQKELSKTLASQSIEDGIYNIKDIDINNIIRVRLKFEIIFNDGDFPNSLLINQTTKFLCIVNDVITDNLLNIKFDSEDLINYNNTIAMNYIYDDKLGNGYNIQAKNKYTNNYEYIYSAISATEYVNYISVIDIDIKNLTVDTHFKTHNPTGIHSVLIDPVFADQFPTIGGFVNDITPNNISGHGMVVNPSELINTVSSNPGIKIKVQMPHEKIELKLIEIETPNKICIFGKNIINNTINPNIIIYRK